MQRQREFVVDVERDGLGLGDAGEVGADGVVVHQVLGALGSGDALAVEGGSGDAFLLLGLPGDELTTNQLRAVPVAYNGAH